MSGAILLCGSFPGLPPTVNHLYRTWGKAKRTKTKAAREWQNVTARMFADWKHNGASYEGDVAVRIRFTTPDKRKWDLDNRLKALLDTLQMAEVIKNDSQIKFLLAERKKGSNDGISSTFITVRAL